MQQTAVWATQCGIDILIMAQHDSTVGGYQAPPYVNLQVQLPTLLLTLHFGSLIRSTGASSSSQLHPVSRSHTLFSHLQVTTLLLQLLFEPRFKKGFLPVMMRHYTHLLRSWFDDSLAAGQPLDMITVQLFNDMVCAWWVMKQHSMATLFYQTPMQQYMVSEHAFIKCLNQ